MPRPRKCRWICSPPSCTEFAPPGGRSGGEQVVMELDEYEAIRLIDLEQLTQEQCARQMGVARTTVQAIYNNARKKLAHSIVHGCRLVIGGGDVRLFEHSSQHCGPGCRRHRCGCAGRQGISDSE